MSLQKKKVSMKFPRKLAFKKRTIPKIFKQTFFNPKTWLRHLITGPGKRQLSPRQGSCETERVIICVVIFMWNRELWSTYN